MIERRSGLKVMLADERGRDGVAIEARSFSYLADRCLSVLPISFPRTNGAPEPMSGGVLANPRGET